jgi:hypothetical protein
MRRIERYFPLSHGIARVASTHLVAARYGIVVKAAVDRNFIAEGESMLVEDAARTRPPAGPSQGKGYTADGAG